MLGELRNLFNPKPIIFAEFLNVYYVIFPISQFGDLLGKFSCGIVWEFDREICLGLALVLLGDEPRIVFAWGLGQNFLGIDFSTFAWGSRFRLLGEFGELRETIMAIFFALGFAWAVMKGCNEHRL